MTAIAEKTSPLVYARTAGALYLVIIVFGVWSELFVRGVLVVPGDAAATAANVIANEGLFRLGFAADSIMALSDVALAILLYVLLAPVSRALAIMAAAFRLTQTAIIGMNLLNHYSALMVLNGAASFAGFDAQQLDALALMSLELQSHGYDLGLLFFGVNSILVGYLIFKSTFLPRALGVLMAAAGLVYLTGSYLLFLAPAQAEMFQAAYLVPLVAELALCLWLLLRGVNVERWGDVNRVAGPA
jgi:hypothetical protein